MHLGEMEKKWGEATPSATVEGEVQAQRKAAEGVWMPDGILRGRYRPSMLEIPSVHIR